MTTTPKTKTKTTKLERAIAAYELWTTGQYSRGEIAKRYGVTAKTVAGWIVEEQNRRHALQRTRPGEPVSSSKCAPPPQPPPPAKAPAPPPAKDGDGKASLMLASVSGDFTPEQLSEVLAPVIGMMAEGFNVICKGLRALPDDELLRIMHGQPPAPKSKPGESTATSANGVRMSRLQNGYWKAEAVGVLDHSASAATEFDAVTNLAAGLAESLIATRVAKGRRGKK